MRPHAVTPLRHTKLADAAVDETGHRCRHRCSLTVGTDLFKGCGTEFVTDRWIHMAQNSTTPKLGDILKNFTVVKLSGYEAFA